MNYKNCLYILIFLFVSNCSVGTLANKNIKINEERKFTNKGFALIYNDDLYTSKLISKKLKDRELIIFQKNLKKNTDVKITNMINQKSIIAKVGSNSIYPSFNNSVITQRIADELDLDIFEPYIEIISIPKNSMFVAKKAKTFDEEKKVADKAPVESIIIKDLNLEKNGNKVKKNNKFIYTIKIADFYFKKSAIVMKDRIINETSIKNIQVKKLSKTNYRVYLGPFYDIMSLQNSFNDINIIGFENLEITKND